MEQNDLLKKLEEITLQFKNTTSRNIKKDLLKKYKDDNDFKQLLTYVYDPFIIFGIGKKKLEKDLKSNINNNNDYKFFDLLKYLSEHNTGSYKEVHLVRCFIDKHYEYKDFIISIITKNLILGIDVKTINSIIPNLCRTFNVQLANKYFDKPEVVEGKEFAITTKIDGMRCIMLKENGNVTFWSRQGQQIEGLVDLEEEAKLLPNDIALDGELVAIVDGPDTYKDTMKKARTKDAEKHGLKMKVFDYMTAEGFRNQNYKDHYLGRCADLIVMFSRSFREECIKRGNEFDKQTLPNFPHFPTDKTEYAEHNFNWKNDQIHFINQHYKYFEILPILYRGTDTSKIIELLDEQTSKGEEGVMINIVDAPYEFKRTNNLLKVKKMQTLDLEVVGFEEGTNSNQGTLGALLVRYKDGNVVKVGSGFEKELRDEIWNNQDSWLGRIVEVQYFEETENADGGKSIRFPVYKDYRTDKTEADY